MPTTTSPTTAPARYMQGIAVPASSVNPTEFFRRTRRHILQEKTFSYTGQTQDVVELRKSDILSGVTIRFSGNINVVPGTGTVASLARWPYDFLKTIQFTANGASNVINASGLKLKVRQMMKRGELTDRGVVQTVGGASKTQGTLALASESWGVGSNTSALANGNYSIDLEWFLPVAEDEIDLTGAIFLATSSSDLTLTLNYAPIAELFALTGNGAVTLTGNFQVISQKFSIPVGPDGQIVVPDLSVFHSLIQSRTTALQNGENEVRLVGQGAGKSLLRVFYQLWNGTPTAPVPMTAANFGKQSWRYASSETPDEFIDGTHMRVHEERYYGSDVGGLWGVGCHDFANENLFRDVVDMGTTSELRLVSTIQSGVTLASPALEYVIESVFRAGQAA
ncbi:MAG: hypothetical protein BGO38_07925 [Cellulomonas sp. 73-145]|uniref:hypothetical protein n=1 Tax=Cellulomonas sp. 73-145 TaxID=1895739 RepID=UPI000929C215|nr:hypothetical protein [Cellulomonas sp. 73-145]MBN9326217.1 hypothetical protein [Cellulomonas sp.]OJV58120.1 MAG: hypothetical protein BGO38_07925 [Cellulomonas sp. 73-145]